VIDAVANGLERGGDLAGALIALATAASANIAR
jgi:hypothetical protein